jgi:hypothetical protein
MCSGILSFRVNGTLYQNKNEYSLMQSGGCVRGDGRGDFIVEKGDWTIDWQRFDQEFPDLKFTDAEKETFERLINENEDIPQGCCGGCT